MTETINIGDCHYKQTSTFKDRLLDKSSKLRLKPTVRGLSLLSRKMPISMITAWSNPMGRAFR